MRYFVNMQTATKAVDKDFRNDHGVLYWTIHCDNGTIDILSINKALNFRLK